VCGGARSGSVRGNEKGTAQGKTARGGAEKNQDLGSSRGQGNIGKAGVNACFGRFVEETARTLPRDAEIIRIKVG